MGTFKGEEEIMGSANQIFEGENPNMKNFSISGPKLLMLGIDMLVEYGIYQSRTEVIRDCLRRIIEENKETIKMLSEVIQYVPVARSKNTKRNNCHKVLNNGYAIMHKGMNEE